MGESKILKNVKSGSGKIFLQFGGQGSPYLKEISKLYEDPKLKKYFSVAFETLKKEENRVGKTNLISQGLDIESWIKNADSAPGEEYLCRGSVSVSMIFITQVANYFLLTQNGYSISDLMKYSVGTTGHSQGVVAAAMAATGKDGENFYQTFSEFLSFIFYLGYRAQESYPYFEIEKSVIEGNAEVGDKNPAPMVACIGYNKTDLESRVDALNKKLNLEGADKIYISLYNTPDSMIISGKPESLLKFRKEYKQEMDEKKAKFVYLRTTAPFHCPLMDASWNNFKNDLQTHLKFPYTGKDLVIPLYSIWDGRNLQAEENLAEILFREVVIKALHWDKAVSKVLNDATVSPVIDFGPSIVSAKLTGGQLTAMNLQNQVLCAANAKELKHLLEE